MLFLGSSRSYCAKIITASLLTMNKFWLDLGCDYRIDNAYKYDSSYLLKISGKNIGNLAFRKALESLINDLHLYQTINWIDAQSTNFSEDSEIIVSCANWLGMTKNDEKSNLYRAQVIEKISGKCIIFGLGSQASFGQNLSFGPNTQRLAHALASKSNLISVRDETTAKALNNIGIHNIEVTGCPSNFINLNLNLNSFRSSRICENSTWKGSKLFISESSGGNELSSKITKRVFSILSQSPGSRYILQSAALLPFLFNEVNHIPKLYEKSSPSDLELLKMQILNSSQVFSSLDEWLFAARFFDLSFGMRIHGTMIPLQSGTPSILIAHDKRTSGLASTMAIPSITCEDFLDISKFPNPYSLHELFMGSLGKYFTRRKSLAGKFLNLITANSFSPTKSFAEYCQNL